MPPCSCRASTPLTCTSPALPFRHTPQHPGHVLRFRRLRHRRRCHDCDLPARHHRPQPGRAGPHGEAMTGRAHARGAFWWRAHACASRCLALASSLLPCAVRSGARTFFLQPPCSTSPAWAWSFVDDRCGFAACKRAALSAPCLSPFPSPPPPPVPQHKYMLTGEFEHYHGEAVNPKHLSLWERWVQGGRLLSISPACRMAAPPPSRRSPSPAAPAVPGGAGLCAHTQPHHRAISLSFSVRFDTPPRRPY
jgi:hypothetical protein